MYMAKYAKPYPIRDECAIALLQQREAQYTGQWSGVEKPELQLRFLGGGIKPK